MGLPKETHTNNEWRLFAEDALALARKGGATYADVRIHPEEKSQDITVEGDREEDGRVVSVSTGVTSGFGVRVLCDGAWGFFATDDLDKKHLERIVARALASARANAKIRKSPLEILPLREDERGQEYFYESPFKIDPFAVSLEDKKNLLLAADRVMRDGGKRVFKRSGYLSAYRFRKILSTTDGVFADQTFTRVGASINALAERSRNDDDRQSCSYPSKHPVVMQQGWEAIVDFDLVKHAARIAEEADRFLDAPETPSGMRDIILMPEQNNLHATHETVHGAEGDRVDNNEWSLAGGSLFSLVLGQIGSFPFGSDAVNIVADSLTSGGVGTYACDDEGVPAKRTILVENGIWKGLLVSRECAPSLNKEIGREYFTEASGAMRASGYSKLPLIRMNNISLLPGQMSYEEMLDRAPIGTIRFANNTSWSIDPYRRDFLFGTELGWEKVLRDGRAVWEPRRNPVYRGDNLKQFFRNCVAVSDTPELYGIGSCGKGTPVQVMATGHSTPPTWFKNIRVDSARARS
ncbi:MAG: TldD/PmbA family protein [bacterium]|nr:TldD/PmbA family protein [bacterium]